MISSRFVAKLDEIGIGQAGEQPRAGGVGIAPEREAQVEIVGDEQAALTGVVDGCQRGGAAGFADERDRAEVKDILPVNTLRV